MAGRGPTPDFDQVTLKWQGVNLDGTVPTGTLELTYNRTEPLLDDDPLTPVSIYPTLLVKPLVTAVIQRQNAAGQMVDQAVGYATFDVPASNDPDIIGSGGTYTLVEKLSNGKGTTRTFIADKDAVGGVIWLNRIVSVTPIPGQAVSAVSVADFLLLKAKLDAVAAGVSTSSPNGSTGTSTGTSPGTSGPSVNDQTTGAATVWSSQKTAAAIQQAVTNLVNGAPAALDTLVEIAAQLAADESTTSTILTALALRLRIDQAQTLTTAQQAQGRTNLGIGFTVKGQVTAMPTTQAQFDATGAAIGEYFEVTG